MLSTLKNKQTKKTLLHEVLEDVEGMSSSYHILKKHQTDLHLLACYEIQILDLLMDKSEDLRSHLSERKPGSISSFALHFISSMWSYEHKKNATLQTVS